MTPQLKAALWKAELIVVIDQRFGGEFEDHVFLHTRASWEEKIKGQELSKKVVVLPIKGSLYAIEQALQPEIERLTLEARIDQMHRIANRHSAAGGKGLPMGFQPEMNSLQRLTQLNKKEKKC